MWSKCGRNVVGKGRKRSEFGRKKARKGGNGWNWSELVGKVVGEGGTSLTIIYKDLLRCRSHWVCTVIPIQRDV